jgi:creatinine amidohydrolase
MQWENLTSYEFEKAVVTCQGVGIISVGVMEPHASHLPLGTDMLAAHWVACRAAEQEPAIVYHQYPYGINHESAHLPGSVVIRRELVFALLENICDEMSRHGLKKIILHNGHGGNRFYLPLFVQTLVELDKDYVVYFGNLPYFPDKGQVLETKEGGHACEAETSTMLHITGENVKMDLVPPKPFTSLKRNQELANAGGYSPVDWYAMYPHMYVGDASVATAEKGAALLKYEVAALVELIRAVKADEVTPALMAEFLAKKHNPKSPGFWTEGS